jgi:hypothetical protein
MQQQDSCERQPGQGGLSSRGAYIMWRHGSAALMMICVQLLKELFPMNWYDLTQMLYIKID